MINSDLEHFDKSKFHHTTPTITDDPVVEQDPEPKQEKTQEWQDRDIHGVFLVDWNETTVNAAVSGLHKFCAIEAIFSNDSKKLVYVNTDNGRQAHMKELKRWSDNLYNLWLDCLNGSIAVHGVVFGVGEESKDVIRAGFSVEDLLVLDLEDLKTFTANSENCKLLMDPFWVLTHELLLHFFLKLTHGPHYLNYDINTYVYEEDDTLKLMTKWSIELGIPDRLQHPPNVVKNKREYIYLDPFPDKKFDDPLDVLLTERTELYKKLRNEVQNKLVLPTGVDEKYFPLGWFIDDDSNESTGNVETGKKVGFGRWRFVRKIH